MLPRPTHKLALCCLAAVVAVAVGVTSRAPFPSAANAAKAASRPNIVLIQADDETVSEFHHGAMPKTKRLLTRQGTTFRDYMATTAQCCPSRASLITGQYAHNDGVFSNGPGYPALVDKDNVLPVWLQRAGYYTMHVGKFMNGYENAVSSPSEVGPGWDQWYTVLGATQYYGYTLYINGSHQHHGTRPGDNATHVLNRDAASLIKRHAKRRRPFYLQLDERAPHVARGKDPFGNCGRAPQPEKRDEERFGNASFPRPPSYNEPNMRDKPKFIRATPRIHTAERLRIRKHWRCALRSISGVDRGIAKVYDAVARAGQIQNTIFIFTSDNGQFFGEHRLVKGKVYPYEEALHLPLVMKVPKAFRRGSRVPKVGRPVANIDLAPTILSYAHATPCPAQGSCRVMDGRSLRPLLNRTGSWPAGRGLLTEYRVNDAGRYSTCAFGGIRTRSTIYVEHTRVVDRRTGTCVNTDQRERYDLKNDPFELHNLCFGGNAASCPANTFVDPSGPSLKERLDALRTCSGIRGRDSLGPGHDYCE